MKVIINPKYNHFKEQIEAIPTSFEKATEVVYTGRNVLKRMKLGDLDVVVKSFKQPHIINRVVYSFFRQSKAERSYLYSMQIQEHGFKVPEPIAMIEEYQSNLLSHSYYICGFDNGETVRSLMDGQVEGNEKKLLAFAHFTASLHKAGILHLDYSPGNILIHDKGNEVYTFSLVDVNRMHLVSDIDCDTVCRNMCRLCISREVLAFIMKEYAILRGWNVDSTVALAIAYSDKFFTRYIYRRAAKKESSKHIVASILFFRFSRSCRKRMAWLPAVTKALFKKEKHIYNKYLAPYDYCHLLVGDYQ